MLYLIVIIIFPFMELFLQVKFHPSCNARHLDALNRGTQIAKENSLITVASIVVTMEANHKSQCLLQVKAT